MTIILNGEPYELASSLSLAALLGSVGIDPRRVVIEHNLTIIRRALFESTAVADGDRVEIANFVGGG